MSEFPLITLGIVDDDALVRSALASLLGDQPDFEVVFECSDGQQAVAACAQYAPDVVLMDIRMPVMDGRQATAELRKTAPAAKVVIITIGELGEDISGCIAAGAVGFLLKTDPPEVIADAIRGVHKGSSVVSPGPLANWAKASTAPATHQADSQLLESLSAREQDVLRLLCNAYTNAEIAEALEVTEATIKAHVSSIMAKMKETSRLKVVVRAMQAGRNGR